MPDDPPIPPVPPRDTSLAWMIVKGLLILAGALVTAPIILMLHTPWGH